MLAGSSEAIDNNLNQVLAKVSPALLRRRSPSPAVSTKSQAQPQTTRDSQGSSSGSSTSTNVAVANPPPSDNSNFLSPPHLEDTPDKGGKPSSDGSSQHSSSPSDTSQLNPSPSGGALPKSPSSGSLGKASKNKVPNQAKKKSWYSVFYPSYKSRSADFKKLFKDVPDEERLLVGEIYFFLVHRRVKGSIIVADKVIQCG